MSKLARERKKHWRVVKAIAKEQGIELLEPRKKYLPKHWYKLKTLPAPNFIPQTNKFFKYLKTMISASMFKPNASQIHFYGLDEENEALRGRSINQVWFDEETIYDKDKSN